MTPTDIRTFVQLHADHVCSHDATRMAADYAEDGVVESPSTGTHRGRQQIEESYKTWVAALVHNSRSRSIIALHPEIRGPA